MSEVNINMRNIIGMVRNDPINDNEIHDNRKDDKIVNIYHFNEIQKKWSRYLLYQWKISTFEIII